MNEPVITRALLEAGGLDAMVARAAPHLTILTEAERAASLRQILADRPAGPAWLFGYGSLIWNPTIHFVERRVAHVQGWRRAFCLSTEAGRGTTDNPGLVLGLDAGGACTGVAFRLDEAVVEAELTLLWRREMLAGSYVPRWVPLIDPDGEAFGFAIAFTINPDAPQYAGDLTHDQVIERLATAAGELGSAADYLFRTCAGLHGHGIADPDLDQLAESVRVVQGSPSA